MHTTERVIEHRKPSAREASRAEWANGWALLKNEQVDEQMAQKLHNCLIWLLKAASFLLFYHLFLKTFFIVASSAISNCHCVGLLVGWWRICFFDVFQLVFASLTLHHCPSWFQLMQWIDVLKMTMKTYHLNVGGGRPSISHMRTAWACSFSMMSLSGSERIGAAVKVRDQKKSTFSVWHAELPLSGIALTASDQMVGLKKNLADNVSLYIGRNGCCRAIHILGFFVRIEVGH